MSYVCKRRPNDGYGCVNLYSGKIKVAFECHSLSKRENGDYNITFLVPGIETIYSDSQKELRNKAFSLITEWFTDAGWQ